MKRSLLILITLAFVLEYLALPELHRLEGCHGDLEHDDNCLVCHLAHYTPYEPAPVQIALIALLPVYAVRFRSPARIERFTPLYSATHPRAPPPCC